MECKSCGEWVCKEMAEVAGPDWIVVTCPWCYASWWYSVVRHDAIAEIKH